MGKIYEIKKCAVQLAEADKSTVAIFAWNLVALAPSKAAQLVQDLKSAAEAREVDKHVGGTK